MTVNAMTDFHAVGDAITDDAPKIQAAIATRDDVYLPTPPTKYKLAANNLFSTRPGQKIFGDGRLRSMFQISSPVPGNGIIETPTGDAGPQLYDFGISFTQPDTNMRANLVTYAPAIYARNAPRIAIERVYIERATVGIDLGGRSGGAVVRDIECCAFSRAIFAEENYDTILIQRASIAAYGVTLGQQQIIYDPATIGIHVGRSDDFKISDSLVAVGTNLKTFRSVDGPVGCQVSNTGFEVGAVEIDSGFMTISGGYFSPALGATGRAIKQTGGDVAMAGTHINSDFGVSPLVEVFGDASFAWSAGNVFMASQDRSAVKSHDAATVINLSAITVYRDENINYAQPTFWKAGGRATIQGTRPGNGYGTGACQVIRVDTDDYDCVSGNVLHGGTVSFPASPLKGVYGPNGH